ncbi:hypothetical protein AKJ62_00180 [candidate division MSBL1 archaeon SCGC-AAA259D14]|uniref:Translation initiation factor 5A C-terminal domain-containing protein n=3 Tax=candidate division MSBL1 TaxID=215777 RepID=A0A133U954_9EURY|nr:hypothetical protein AKJ62_00180 [candidate division MSBL1 archaeon SCGC-AAA259D14]KXA94837.1 hypothetical protein AKJ36_02130 [candidate division MSBL1 archaeon SCGC-AAA259I07]KXA98836.1 hypothetical protein AKJ39_00640 [candidate division MSBL1 archaeon SCGC-AAA259J03]
MGRESIKIKNLEVGDYVIVNEEPCQVTKKSTSSTDKEGKEKIYVEGLFDGQKRTFVKDMNDEVEAPLMERGCAQILAIIENNAQLIDLESYETFELTIPLDFRGELEEGDEIEYIQALGRKKISKKRG